MKNMKNRSLCAALVIAGAMILLSACSQGSEFDASKLDKLKSEMEKEDETPSKPESSKTKKKKVKEETVEEKESAGLFADAFADGEVEGNGGLFVRVGNRVYYRLYNTRSIALTSMGDCFVEETRTDLPSTLMYFDLDKDETVEVAAVSGIGPLYACTDGICLMSYPDGYPSTTLVDEDGNVNESYLPANITGVSTDGHEITVGESDENDDIIPVLYRDGVRIGETEEPDNDRDDDTGVYLSAGTYGDLVYRDGNGVETVVYKDYVYNPGESAMYRTAIEGAVCFDNDALFVIKADANRAPDEDMGGRMAYDLDNLSYECYRFDDEHKTEHGAKYFGLGGLSSAGWDHGVIEYDRLIGSWECNSAIVEGYDYQVYKEDPTVEVITFNEDGSGVISRIDRKSGKKFSEDRPIHQVEADEYGPDYAFNYETDDADPQQVGICFLSHGRLGIHHLYHYDGTSTGWYMGSYYKAD